MTEDIPDAPPVAVAPPTQPGMVSVPQQGETGWPKVIGIIAIVLGSLGVLGGMYGVVSPLLLGWMADMMPPGQATSLAVIQEFSIWVVFGSLLGLAVATWLLFGGIALVKRRRSSRKICLGWAVVKMVFVVANTVASFAMAESQMEAMAQDPNLPPLPAGFASGMAIFGAGFGVCWGWALPVFMLIWFSRSNIKSQMALWE